MFKNRAKSWDWLKERSPYSVSMFALVLKSRLPFYAI